ncbi:MAG: hypothetical protein AB1634_12095 [Thermodesulfobacteriota bacterium]
MPIPRSRLALPAAGAAVAVFLAPAFSWASGASPQFYASVWLVRLWLGLVGGTVAVMSLIYCLEHHTSGHTLHPARGAGGETVITKAPRLSYLNLSKGMAGVVVGSLLMVTAAFLLPDKRTGAEGICRVMEGLKACQVILSEKLEARHDTVAAKRGAR